MGNEGPNLRAGSYRFNYLAGAMAPIPSPTTLQLSVLLCICPFSSLNNRRRRKSATAHMQGITNVSYQQIDGLDLGKDLAAGTDRVLSRPPLPHLRKRGLNQLHAVLTRQRGALPCDQSVPVVSLALTRRQHVHQASRNESQSVMHFRLGQATPLPIRRVHPLVGQTPEWATYRAEARRSRENTPRAGPPSPKPIGSRDKPVA